LPWNAMPSRSDEKPQRRSAWKAATGMSSAPGMSAAHGTSSSPLHVFPARQPPRRTTRSCRGYGPRSRQPDVVGEVVRVPSSSSSPHRPQFDSVPKYRARRPVSSSQHRLLRPGRLTADTTMPAPPGCSSSGSGLEARGRPTPRRDMCLENRRASRVSGARRRLATTTRCRRSPNQPAAPQFIAEERCTPPAPTPCRECWLRPAVPW